MKKFVIGMLVVLGMYWLFNHYPPLPFNHEQLGMPFHTVHRILGVIFFVIAIILWKKWNPKKK